MNKKTILKKYTGKGGPITADTIRQMRMDDDMRPNYKNFDSAKLKSPGQLMGSFAKGVAKGAGAVAGVGLGAVKKAGNRVMDSFESKLKNIDSAKREGNMKMINENFGNLSNYTKTIKAPAKVAPVDMQKKSILNKKLKDSVPLVAKTSIPLK